MTREWVFVLKLVGFWSVAVLVLWYWPRRRRRPSWSREADAEARALLIEQRGYVLRREAHPRSSWWTALTVLLVVGGVFAVLAFLYVGNAYLPIDGGP